MLPYCQLHSTGQRFSKGAIESFPEKRNFLQNRIAITQFFLCDLASLREKIPIPVISLR